VDAVTATITLPSATATLAGTAANGATTQILVGGGAAALPVWTTATGTGAPVRAGSPTFTGTVTFGGGINASGDISTTSNSSGFVWYFTGGSPMQYGDSNGSGGGPNTSKSVMLIKGDSGTGRSISAGGTLNASGADYAEYERLSVSCGKVAKGQIIGFDADGKVTDKWADAISFGVKSTNPSYVGGDVWGSNEAVGLDGKPLGEKSIKPPQPEENEVPATEEYAFNNRQTEIDAAYKLALTKHAEEKAAFESRLEPVRKTVDRIAYSGKVPVIVNGAKVGDYIVPVESSGGINGKPVTSPSFDEYRIAVGQVRRVLPDGRAEISVKVG